MKKINIAIDGPAGAGKSTIAKLLAKELGYTYIDTGAMYRSLAYLVIKNNVDFSDIDRVVDLLKNDFDFEFINEKAILNNEDVTSIIRNKEISSTVSFVVSDKRIREIMVKKQQELATKKGVCMDGRDIGSVVLKDAELKIFLIADKEARAQRRFIENKEKGIETTYEEVLENLEKRDYVDTYLSKALVKTEDAIELDTTHLNIEQTLDKLIDLVSKKVN